MPKNAIIKKTNINGDETLYIPLSVGSSNFNAEEFQALVVELINIFKQHPNTPVYLQIFDTIHAEMLLVERADVFKYVHEDFLEEDDNKYSEKQKAEFKDAFAKKVVTYRDRALEIVRKNAEKREKNCEQSILQLKKHFTNVNIEHWETKKIQLTVKWAEHDLQRNDVVKNGFIRKIEEYNIKRNSDKVFAKQWQVALREYYIHLCKRTLVHDQINLKGARSTDSLNELFVQSQLTKCLDQYIVTMTETIRELQSRIVTGSVCLVSPYSGVDHLEPFTLHAVKRNLGCNGVSPQLETPEVEFTFDNNKSAEIVGQQLHKSDTQDNLYKKHYEKLYRFAFYQSQNTHFQKAGESKAIGLLADKLLCLCEGDMKKQLRIIDQFKIFQEIIDNFSSYKKYHKSYKAKTDRTAFFKKANSKPCKDDEDYDAVCYVAYKLQPLLKGDKKKQANIFYQFKFFQQMIENLQSFDKTKEIKFPNANSSTIDDIHSKQSKAERDEEEALCKVVVELGPKMQDDKIEQADIFYQFKYFQDCVAKNR